MFVLAGKALWKLEKTGTATQWLPECNAPVCVAVGQTLAVVANDAGELICQSDQHREPMRVATQIPDPVTPMLVLQENPMTLLVGTENPELHRIENHSTKPVTTFNTLPCRPEWHTPWGGPAALRSLAKGGNGWVYADIHVGSIMRSPDNGASWQHVTRGFPESTRQNINTFHLAFTAEGTAWAAVENRLLKSEDNALSWHDCWTAPAPIDMLAAP